ncbi:MAP kinase-activated protein kinase 2 (Fragment) [Seminavis robusta]|uniref:non-specific serine/threonine protein kinase n=1 Tax=Seminavis robusta TaxID=568900 RepID=A0A9N8H9A3_9STRA
MATEVANHRRESGGNTTTTTTTAPTTRGMNLGSSAGRRNQMASQQSFRVQALVGRHGDAPFQGSSMALMSMRSGKSINSTGSGFRVPRTHNASSRRLLNLSFHGSTSHMNAGGHPYGHGSSITGSIPDFTNSIRIDDLGGMDDDSNMMMSHGSLSQSHSSKQWAQQSVKFRAQQFVATNVDSSIEAHYTIGDLLGEGGFGEVYACVDKQTGEPRAVKVVGKHAKKEDNDKVIAEFDIVKNLDHPNILKLYALFESETHFFLVTDIYAGGELYDELEEFGRFNEDDAALLMNNVLSCLNYCHKNKRLAHRDLKPENILLEENKNFEDLKIIDFGLAAYGDRFTELEGSTYYMSPQVIQGNYDCKCDIWSCGVIAYVCLAGFAPFDGADEQDVVQSILCGRVDFEDASWDDVSENAMDFIAYLLAYEEDNRPTAEQALQHPWLQQIRQRRDIHCQKRRESTRMSLGNLQSFQANSKLKQCVCSLIASQFLKKQEKEEIDNVFRSLDHDCDGKLTRQDVETSYKEFFGHALSDADLNSMFEQVNFSGSGAIEYSEFVVASLMEKNLIDDFKLMAAFKIFDKENKGYISVDNLKEVLSLDDDMEGYILNVIVRQVDDNGDGKISFDEFKDMMFSTAVIPPKPSSSRRAARLRNSSSSINNNKPHYHSSTSTGTSGTSIRNKVVSRANRSTCSSTLSVESFSMASSVALTITEDVFEEENTAQRREREHRRRREEAELLGENYDDNMSVSNASFRHVLNMFDEKNKKAAPSS